MDALQLQLYRWLAQLGGHSMNDQESSGIPLSALDSPR
jgi:hypothetical protein